MSGDPLFRPLGAELPRSAPRGLWLIPIAVAVMGVGAGAWALRQGREPGRAVAIATIETAQPVAPLPVPPPPASVAASAPVAAAPAETTTVEMQNGVKIVRFNAAASAHGLTALPVPSVGASAGALMPNSDPRVTEATARGLQPRIGDGALRPSEVHARPVPAAAGPRLALLVTGMGGDQLATADAARRLPPDVTFGFAPDVPDGAAQVEETRRAGHEVLLDLSQKDGAAETGGADGLAVLHRQMAAFAGYAGVVADPTAPPATLHDLADRGLLLVVPGSVASGTTLAPDITVDAISGHAALGGVIDKLGGIARSKGTALGIVTHAGAASGEIAGLLGTLSRAGVTIVPVTALGAAGASAAR